MGFHNKINNSVIIFLLLTLLQHIFYFIKYNIQITYIILLIQFLIFCINIKNIIYYKKYKDIDFKKYIYLFWILIFISIISSIFSPTFLLSFKRILLVYLPIIMLSLLILLSDKKVIIFNKILKIYIIFTSLLSIYGIFLITLGKVERIPYGFNYIKIIHFYLGQVVMGQPPIYRISSLTTNPNTLGILVTIGILSLFYLKYSNNLNKIIYYGLLLLNSITLLYSQSRAAIISCIIMVTIFLLSGLNLDIISAIKEKLTKKRVIIFTVIFILIIFFIVNIPLINNRLGAGLNSRSESWIYLIESIFEKPFIGVGFGTSYENILLPNNVLIGAHNFYLSLVSEIGTIGFFIFMFLWFSIIFNSIKKYIKIEDINIKTLYRFIFSYNIGLLFHQMVENQLLRFNFVMLFLVYTFFLSVVPLKENTFKTI